VFHLFPAFEALTSAKSELDHSIGQ